jgi:hypothetical protein
MIRPCYGPVETGLTDREFERALARRFNADDPLGAGSRWEAEAFTAGWMQVFPVYSHVRSLYRRLRGWSPDPGYIGGATFVRRSDGLLVELGSSPFQYCPDVFEGVFRDSGETAAAREIKAEIIARSEAHWAEYGFADGETETFEQLAEQGLVSEDVVEGLRELAELAEQADHEALEAEDRYIVLE